MSETLYATYSDPVRAQKACEELLAKGVKQEMISLLVKHHDKLKSMADGVDLEDTRPTTPMRGTEFFKGIDPMGEGTRQLSVARIERGLDAEVSRNPGEGDKQIPARANVTDQEQKDTLESTPFDDTNDPNASLRFSRGYNAVGENSPENIRVDPDADAYRDTDPQMKEHLTAHDVSHGVAQGAGIGLGIGAAAAVVTLLIPGLGLVVGGGAMALAASALAAGAGAGAVAGGVSGLLRQQGLPDDRASDYARTFDGGGAILSVTITDAEMRDSIEETLRSNGAQSLETHQAYLS
jgi:hypothetical protein